MATTKKNSKIILYIIIILFVIICLNFIFPNIGTNESSAYPEVEHSKLYQGRVKKALLNRGSILMKLSNNESFSFSACRNYNYSSYYIDEFLKYGDSIVKPKNSDTLFIHRENKMYFFIIGNSDLNKPVK